MRKMTMAELPHFIQRPFPNQFQFGLEGKKKSFRKTQIPNLMQIGLENFDFHC